MKTFRSKVLLGLAAALGMASTAAHAAITISSSTAGPDSGPPAGFVTVLDYDGASGYFTEGGSINVLPAPGVPNLAVSPLGDTTNFAYVGTGADYTLSAPLITGLSLYVGSIDSNNFIDFYYQGALVASFAGSSFGAPAILNHSQGDPENNRRLTFDFGGAKVDQVDFHSGYQAFEWDTIAVPSAVPEPATWAMMITGFGLMGAMLRRRRPAVAAA